MYTPFKMKGHTLPGINQKIDKKKSALKNKDLDSIDNNRHAPARTKDTVDPADVKRREKKNTSKRVPTDREARAEAAKSLYNRKSPAKKKKECGSSAVKLLGRKKKNSEGGVTRSVTKKSGYGLQPTVTQTSSTKKDGKFVRTTTNTADRPLAKEKHEYLRDKGKFPSAQAEADHAKKNKVYSSTVTKQSTKKGKKTFTAADGNPKHMTKTKTKKDGTVKTKKKRYRKNVFKGQPGVRPL